MVRSTCNVHEQIVNAQPCLAGEALQQFRRSRMHAVLEVGDRRLRHINALRERFLCRVSAFPPELQSLHGQEDIGLPYRDAIGESYEAFGQNWPMARLKDRSFLARALEALGERYPRERPTQVRLAKIAGVSQPAVHEWGLPNRAPEHDSVLKLAHELNVCVEWLYTERGPKRPQKPAESADPFLQQWDNLPAEVRQQIARYADFIKNEPPPRQ